MSLAAGDKLGPYEILALIGAGGMGEVYRARDTRLGRDVAIKVSAQQFSERFDREARAVAALNHPNICTLYDVGPNYLVMEYIEGESPKGPLPLEETLRISLQIADALEAAHEKGITHRDLKPGNIKVKPDGTVKVLDFGLAKVSPTSPGDPENSPTLSMAATQVGMILGTAGYMAPEQARGKPVDKRADIWAFGVIVCELLTGERMFEGETISDTLAQVLMKEPDLSRVPPKARRLLTRCLQKEPKLRLRDIAEARFLLEEEPALAPTFSARTSRTPWIITAVLAAIAAATTLLWLHARAPEPAAVMRFEIAPPVNAVFNNAPAISPDGQSVAFIGTEAGKRMLYVRPLNSFDARVLPGTDEVVYAFWSPDGRSLGFVAGAGVEGVLKRIDLVGGGPRVITTETRGDNGTWGQQGDILTYVPPVIRRLSASGGASTAATQLDTKRGETSHRFPQFLPDGKHFLFFAFGKDQGHNTVEFGELGTFDRKTVLESVSAPIYGRDSAGDGYLIYLRDQTLFAQRFNESNGSLIGEAAPVADDVAGIAAQTLLPAVSASWNGILLYRPGSSGGLAQLTWFDRDGKITGKAGEPGPYSEIAISPDGTRAAVSRSDGQKPPNIWLLEFGRDIMSRFTSGRFGDHYPLWSPTGDRIVYSSLRKNRVDLYWKRADGTGSEELLYASDDDKTPTSWSSDGRFLLYHSSALGATQGSGTGNDIWMLPLEGDRKPIPLLQTNSNEMWGSFSPDGKWIAYQSNESGRNEVYVRSLALSGTQPPALGGATQISKVGGWMPKWRKDGKEIAFSVPSPAGTEVMVAEVSTNPKLKVEIPRRLFAMNIGFNNLLTTPGGDFSRFLLAVPPQQNPSQAAPLKVILNWTAGLKR